MNRLDSLAATLPVNIKNDHRGDSEFVLLDYNSADGLEKWVKSNLKEYIKTGQLDYYRLTDPKPQYFSHSLSRNIAFRLAKGELLCNLNADYYLGPEFFNHIPKLMSESENVAFISNLIHSESDNYGRICLRRNHFMSIGGYDERFVDHGYEDVDLCSRLGMSGVSVRQLDGDFWKRFVPQENKSRLENTYDYNNILFVYIKKMQKGTSLTAFLYKSGKVQIGTLQRSNHDVPILLEVQWKEGTWHRRDGNIDMRVDGNLVSLINSNPKLNGASLIDRKDTENFNKMILLKSHAQNYTLMRENIRNRSIYAYHSSLGEIKLKKNFEVDVCLDLRERMLNKISRNTLR